MRLLASMVVSMALAGCISTAKELQSQSEHRATVERAENYQAVYKHVLDRARECLDLGGTLTSSNKLDGQLYSDLGVGELSYYLDAVVDLHFAFVQVKRAGTGAVVEIATGSQPDWANRQLLERIKRWAEGGTSC